MIGVATGEERPNGKIVVLKKEHDIQFAVNLLTRVLDAMHVLSFTSKPFICILIISGFNNS